LAITHSTNDPKVPNRGGTSSNHSGPSDEWF
jgi:hypothetical protein